MQDESKKEEYPTTGSQTAKGKPGNVYGASNTRKSSFLQNSESKIKILESESNKTLKVSWNPKNHMLAFGGDNGYSALWNISESINTAALINDLPHIMPDQPKDSLPLDKTIINSIDWKPDGSGFVTGSNDGITRMWDCSGSPAGVMLNEATMPLTKKEGSAAEGESLGKDQISPMDIDPVYDLKWNKDGSAIVTVSEKNNVILWNTEGQLRGSYQGHTDPVTTIDWKNNNMFATGSQNGIIKIWDVQSSSAKKTLNSHESSIKALQWDPTGAFLASGGEDCVIKVWNPKHDNTLVSFNEHSEMIHDLKWSPTGYGSSNQGDELRLAS